MRRTAGKIVDGFGALRLLGVALAMSAAVLLLVFAVPGESDAQEPPPTFW